MKPLIILSLVFCLTATTQISAQTNSQQNERFKAIYNGNKTLVESQDYKFIGEWIFGDDIREQLDAASNIINIEKLSSTGQLSALGSDDKTYDFDGMMENYQVNYNNEALTISIQFNVKTKASETHKVVIEVKPNGNVFLTLNSGNSAKISYRGKLG